MIHFVKLNLHSIPFSPPRTVLLATLDDSRKRNERRGNGFESYRREFCSTSSSSSRSRTVEEEEVRGKVWRGKRGRRKEKDVGDEERRIEEEEEEEVKMVQLGQHRSRR